MHEFQSMIHSCYNDIHFRFHFESVYIFYWFFTFQDDFTAHSNKVKRKKNTFVNSTPLLLLMFGFDYFLQFNCSM